MLQSKCIYSFVFVITARRYWMIIILLSFIFVFVIVIVAVNDPFLVYRIHIVIKKKKEKWPVYPSSYKLIRVAYITHQFSQPWTLVFSLRNL